MNTQWFSRLSIIFIVVCMILFPNLIWAESDFSADLGIVEPRTVKQAPDFTLQTLDGQPIKLSDFRGKPVLLNFWATWCEACKKEFPAMQRLYSQLKGDGFEIIAVSVDRRNRDRIEDFVKAYEIDFPILLDPQQKARRDYFIRGLPTSYLIDSAGDLRGFISGARAWDHVASRKALLNIFKNVRLSKVSNPTIK
jgi:peroxiredoxin